jgi:beta-lactamase class A
MGIVATSYKNLKANRTLVLVAVISFIVGAVCAGFIPLFPHSAEPMNKVGALRESNITTPDSTYKLIDPLIGVKGIDQSAQYNAMQSQVVAYIASQKSSGLVSASVEFRDIGLPGGFVLNPSTLYTPASLNKVPLMMAYFKMAETDPSILSQEITYPSGTANDNDMETIKPAVQISPGSTYTIEELIEHMIRYSDNNATDLLTQYLNETNNFAAYRAVFTDLGVDPDILTTYTDNMTVGDYSTFLRSLYNSTYLDWDHSELALELLTETDFSEGIEGGVPNDVQVAEKFGEVRLVNSSGSLVGRELNNCGIVYYPNRPYLLCVMMTASGDNIQALENEIGAISNIVYKNMETLYP